MQQPDAMVDVTFLLEGTYPFVRGGVSSWVHELITAMPELSFSLVYLGATPRDLATMRYELPPNVRQLHYFDLMTSDAPAPPNKGIPGDPAYFAANAQLHDWFRAPGSAPVPAVFDAAILQPGRSDATCAAEFFHSEAAWGQIVESYERTCPHASLMDYFWSVRNTHEPLMKLVRIARAIPASRLVHAVSTGYAGFLGAMLQRLSACPMVLTEHGMYTKERQIELQSLFLGNRVGKQQVASASGMEAHELLWIRMFEGLGRLAYAAADPIISLYPQNQARQIGGGALAERTRIIPNGVDVARFAPLRLQRPERAPHVLGLLGRVVPIKDIKTFIRTIHVLRADIADVQGWIIGPQDEDAPYVEECMELVRMLELEDHVRFLGFQRIDAIMPQLGLVVLTSISEAFPLVIGESYASGVPVLTTDVGACRSLVEGAGDEDRALGCGGAVVPIVDPEAMAAAALALLADPDRWRAAQQAGIARVERYYRQDNVVDAYRQIYAEAKAS